MDETTDYLKMVTDKEAEFSSLFSRMDKDKDLAVLKEYKTYDKDDRTAPDVDDITLNDPRTFYEQVKSNLISGNMQTVVEGEKLNDEETTFVEDFIRDIGLAIDERVQKRDIPSFHIFSIEQICVRGRAAGRVCLRMEGDTFVPDVLPYDTRYLIYDLGSDGYKWVAPRMYRSKDQVISEYGKTPKSSKVTITDLWLPKTERIYAENNPLDERPNKYGYPPWVIQLSPTGFLFQDEDRLQYEGESIFAPNRDLYEAKNKVGSLLMTLTVMAAFHGLQYKSEAGTKAQKPKQSPYGKRTVLPVEKDGGYELMPFRDVTNATRWLYQMLENALQKGSLPAVSYGNLTFPLSAVAITSLTEAEDPVYLPRMQGLALYYQRLYRMIIDQYIQQKMNVKLGQKGFQKEYPYTELNKEYTIKFKFFATSPKQNIANYSIGQAAKSLGISDDTIWRDILKLENPNEEWAKSWSEKADRMVPSLALYKMARAKIDQGNEVEAKLIASQLGLTLEQIRSGKLAEKPVEVEGEKATKPIVPLLTGGQGGMVRPGKTSAKEAVELEVEQEAED